jgi:hypothetical protein
VRIRVVGESAGRGMESWDQRRSTKIPHRLEADRSGAEDHATCEWRER